MKYYNSETLLEQQQEIQKLKDERDALAAELAALCAFLDEVVCVMNESQGVWGWHKNHTIATWNELFPAVPDFESPQHHLRQVRADAVDEFMNKAMHEIANSYTSSTPVTPWESGMNSMLAMFAKYTQKYLKILRNNESTSILAGKE